MRLAVTEIPDQAQAMPAAGKPGRDGLGLDEPDFVGVMHAHDSTQPDPPVGVSVPLIRTAIPVSRCRDIPFSL
ncbi:hypothetical protein MOKP125_15030 [Mycobacterium avium subsp. hominissuis]